jgi:hypothetical protein
MTLHGMGRPGTSTRWIAMGGDRSFILTVVVPGVDWRGGGERRSGTGDLGMLEGCGTPGGARSA